MAKKEAIVNENAAAKAPAKPARAASPKSPRVKAAQHSKTISPETAAVSAGSEGLQDVIAKMAYGYWESRGYKGGSALEDWVRAEHEIRQR